MSGEDLFDRLEYTPGAWAAVAGPRCWLLAEAAPHGPAAQRWWQLVRQSAPRGKARK